MRHRVLLAVLALLVPVLAGGCGSDEPEGGQLTLGTGNRTGVYSVLGGGYAGIVREDLPGWTVTTRTSGGPAENIDRLVDGSDQLGFASLSWASDAITGQGEYQTPQPIRALARLYLNYVQVIVRSGVTGLPDLRGRRVSTGSPGSTGELAAGRLLRFAGLDLDRDTKRVRLSLDDSAKAMEAGQLDAIFWSGGLPTGGVGDLFEAMGRRVTVLDLGAYYQQMSDHYPFVYERASIPAATYGLAAPVLTIAEPNLLLVRDDMDPELAGRLTAALLDNLPRLAAVHPEGGNISRARAERTDPVPLHSGALHWYRDHPVG